jgi:hypothetical protein
MFIPRSAGKKSHGLRDMKAQREIVASRKIMDIFKEWRNIGRAHTTEEHGVKVWKGTVLFRIP